MYVISVSIYVCLLPVCTSVYLYVCLSVCLSVCMYDIVCMYVMSLSMSVCLPVCTSVYLYVCMSACLSVCLFTYMYQR